MMDAIDEWVETNGASGSAEWELREAIHDAHRCGTIDTVLEIGTFRGDSLRVWNEAFSPSLLIGVELEDSERISSGLARISQAVIVKGSSQKHDTWVAVKNLLGDRLVDFLYIDGDHLYDAARRDFFMYAPLVRSGGLVVLDDATLLGNHTVEVYRLVPELQSMYRTKLLTGCTNYLSPEVTGGKLLVFV